MNYLHQYIEFLPTIEEIETELEPGMRAFIIQIDDKPETECVTIQFNTEEYTDRNHKLLPNDYYDKSGNPCLTAIEAGFWPENERHKIYFDVNDDLSKYFKIIEKEIEPTIKLRYVKKFYSNEFECGVDKILQYHNGENWVDVPEEWASQEDEDNYTKWGGE